MEFDTDSFEKLNNRISQLHGDNAFAAKHYGLIYLLLVQRFLKTADEFKEALVDGSNDCGIDAKAVTGHQNREMGDVFQFLDVHAILAHIGLE